MAEISEKMVKEDENVVASNAEQTTEKAIREMVRLRLEQSSLSRLVEFVTNFRPENPELKDKVEEDRESIRQKYNLPPRDMKYVDPFEYERQLREIAIKLKIQIRQTSDCGDYFQNSRAEGAFFEDSMTIGVTVWRDSLYYFYKSITNLEHELVHAIQNKFFPRMPIELREYEAYVIGSQMKNLSSLVDILFGRGVLGSVMMWYKRQNDELADDEEPIKPIWDDPVYFLKKSGLTDEQIAIAVADLGLSRK